MPTEIESKLRILNSQLPVKDLLAELQQKLSVPDFSSRHLCNIYYDTAELDLHKARVALRLRDDKGQWLQTFKTAGQVVDGIHRRGEWEWPLAESALNTDLLRELDVWPKGVALEALKPVFETNFDRYKACIEYQGAQIELALDRGAIVSAGHSEVIYELELELLDGSERVLAALTGQLKNDLDVELYDLSKAERGYALFQQN